MSKGVNKFSKYEICLQDVMLCGGSDAAIIPIGIILSLFLSWLVWNYLAMNTILIQQSLVQVWEALWPAEHSHKGIPILPKLHALGTL